MHENNTPELGLGEQIKSACSTAFSKAKNYLLGAIPSVALYVKVDGKLVADKALHTHLLSLETDAKVASQIEMRVEVYGSGSSETALNVLAEETFSVKTDNGGSRKVPMIETKGSEPDVVNITPLEGFDPSPELFKVLAHTGYAAISDTLAVSAKKSLTPDAQKENVAKMFRLKDQEWNLGVWLVNLFKDPVSLKAYLSHSLGAAVYRNWNRDCTTSKEVYIADFSKVNCRSGKQEGPFLRGTDGMNISSGPDAKVEQIRYVTLWGVDIEKQNYDFNFFAKGLLSPTYLSKIEGNTLVFDKEGAKQLNKNLVVLDIANVKSDSKDELKKLVKEHGIIKVDPRSPVDTICDFLWSVTKISEDERSSVTYQHVNNMFVSDPKLLKDLLGSYLPPRLQSSKKGFNVENTIAAALGTAFGVDNLNADLLAGNRSAKRILSDIAAYLPSIKMRKCIMSSLLTKGQAVALDKNGDPMVRFVFMRNPCLLPNSLKVLHGVRHELIQNIFNLDDFGKELVIISPEDASDAQADDDGDSVGCDPNPKLIALIEEHQRFVDNSILRYAPKIELAKEARISYQATNCVGTTLSNIINNRDYVNLCVLQPEQPLVGWGSDMAVNLIRSVNWKWVTSSSQVPEELMKMKNVVKVVNEVFSIAKSNDPSVGLWVPANEADVQRYCSWLCLVFITQTAIDWKKRMYKLMSLFVLGFSYIVNQNGKFEPSNQRWNLKSTNEKQDIELNCNSPLTKQFDEKFELGGRYIIETDTSKAQDVVGGNVILARYLMSDNAWSFAAFSELFDEKFVNSTWENIGLWSIVSLGVVGTTLSRGIDLDWKRLAKSGLKVTRDVSREDILLAFQKMYNTCGDNCVVKHLLSKSLQGSYLKPSVLSEYIAAYNSVHQLIENWETVMDSDPEFKAENKQLLLNMSRVNLGSRKSMDLTGRRVATWVEKANIDLQKSENFKYFLLLAGEGGIEDLAVRHLITELALQINPEERLKKKIEQDAMNALDNWIWVIWKYAFKKMTTRTLKDVTGINIEKPTVDNLLLLKKRNENGHSPIYACVKELNKFDNTAQPKTIFIQLVECCLLGDFGTNRKLVNFIKNDPSYVSDYQKHKSLSLSHHLEAVFNDIQRVDNAVLKKDLVSIVVSNIARTLRSVNALSLLGTSEDRTKDMWHDDGPRTAKDQATRQMSMFSSSDSLPTAIEKLILSKGYVPAQVAFQKKVVRGIYAWSQIYVERFNFGNPADGVPGKCKVISKSIANSGDRKIPYSDFIRYSLGCRVKYELNSDDKSFYLDKNGNPILPNNFLDEATFNKKYRS